MSLNDKARAALKRELSRAFPERAADDPGHDRLAEALSKPTHTPGPWSIASHNGTDIGIIARNSGKGGQMVALAIVDEDVAQEDDEHRANARLIAAAPELLEALKGFVQWVTAAPESYQKHYADRLIAARAAIARASGGAA